MKTIFFQKIFCQFRGRTDYVNGKDDDNNVDENDNNDSCGYDDNTGVDMNGIIFVKFTTAVKQTYNNNKI